MARSGKDSDDEKEKDKWDGNPLELEEFDKKMARWCRKKFGTSLGNDFWADDLPDLTTIPYGTR